MSDVSEINAQMAVEMNSGHLLLTLKEINYRPGWEFNVVSHAGWYRALRISVKTKDPHALNKDGADVDTLVDHEFQIPYFTMSEAAFLRWILDCILAVETHEACEWLYLNGVAPFMPEHGFNSNPYMIPEAYANVERET